MERPTVAELWTMVRKWADCPAPASNPVNAVELAHLKRAVSALLPKEAPIPCEFLEMNINDSPRWDSGEIVAVTVKDTRLKKSAGWVLANNGNDELTLTHDPYFFSMSEYLQDTREKSISSLFVNWCQHCPHCAAASKARELYENENNTSGC